MPLFVLVPVIILIGTRILSLPVKPFGRSGVRLIVFIAVY